MDMMIQPFAVVLGTLHFVHERKRTWGVIPFLSIFMFYFLLHSTIGIEIIEDVPCADAVIVPVGGAGLIAGISCAVKTLKPECKVGAK